jgi:hypothetical protein
MPRSVERRGYIGAVVRALSPLIPLLALLAVAPSAAAEPPG